MQQSLAAIGRFVAQRAQGTCLAEPIAYDEGSPVCELVFEVEFGTAKPVPVPLCTSDLTEGCFELRPGAEFCDAISPTAQRVVLREVESPGDNWTLRLSCLVDKSAVDVARKPRIVPPTPPANDEPYTCRIEEWPGVQP